MDSKPEIPYLLEALALTAADGSRFQRATRLWGAASAVRSAVHAQLQPSYAADHAPSQDKARAALGQNAFAIAWAEGRAMTLAEALALAAEEVPPAAAAAPAPASPAPEPPAQPQPRPYRYGLTPREVEVLRLVASGLTDAQVAEELVISPRTVGKHLESIYGKLQLPSRSAATRWAIEHHLG